MALDGFDLTIEGAEELMSTIDKMAECLKPDIVEPMFKRGAQAIAKEARARAPVRKQVAHDSSKRKAPGVLKRSIKAKGLKRLGTGAAPYIAAIDRKPARHAWLVIHGTRGQRQVNPPRWVTIGGQPARITHTGVMPRNPFWGDAIRARQAEVLERLAKDMGRVIEEAMR